MDHSGQTGIPVPLARSWNLFCISATLVVMVDVAVIMVTDMAMVTDMHMVMDEVPDTTVVIMAVIM